MTTLTGRVAVVTGSSTGIGHEIAQKFLEEGASVIINSRDADRASRSADALAQYGPTHAVAADVSSSDGCEKLAQAAVDRFGQLDTWVSNAGTNAVQPSLDLPSAEFDRVIAVNLNACFYGAQAAGRVMSQQDTGGVILQIGSIFSQTAFPMRAAYAASKHGMVGLLKVLATEWAEKGIRVLNLDPGYIEATGQGHLDPDDPAYYTDDQVQRRTPLHRFGTAREVAEVAAFLASDKASYMTGSSVAVDGGWLAYGGF